MTLSWTGRSGAVCLIMLYLFAWTYHLERMTCADSAFFSWLLIDAKHPVSVLGRYGSWIPQLPSWLLLRWGAPLETVLRAYSVSLIAVHAVVLWVVVGRFKDRRGAFVLPLALTAGFHYMFYFAISKLYQGMSLTILLWVLLRRWLEAAPGRTRVGWVAACVLLNAWISFYHQLLVLPLIFLLVHEGIRRGAAERKHLAWIGAALVGWYALRILLMSDSTYEQSRMPTASDLLHHGTRLMDLKSTEYLLSVWTKFPALLLLMAAGLVAGIVRRAWLSTLWALLFSSAFLVLVLIVDRDGGAVTIYENYYPLIGLFWAVLLIDALPEQGRLSAYLGKGAFISIALLGLVQIHKGHDLFTQKVAYMQRITAFWEAQGARKLLVEPANFPWAYGMGDWPISMETALASSMNGAARCATVYVPQSGSAAELAVAGRENFLGPSWSPLWFSIPTLDRRYFELPTDTGYRWINTADSTFDMLALELTAPSTPFHMPRDRFGIVPITIRNPTIRLMPSCSSAGVPYRLGYRLFHRGGAEVGRGSELSALETDIPAGMTYHQGLVIERPEEAGAYWVIADLLINGEPFGKYVTFDIEVD